MIVVLELCCEQDLVSAGEEDKETDALGDVVEEELAATSQAVEEAAARIQVSGQQTMQIFTYVYICIVGLVCK